MTDEELVDRIQFIRAKNNVLWMDIMRVALKYAPERTKETLKAIKDNDLEISRLTGAIANED